MSVSRSARAFAAWIGLCGVVLMSVVSSAQAEGLSAQVELKITEKSGVRVVAGTLEYQSPTEVYLAATAPEKQLVHAHANTLSIYYPDQKVLMRGSTSNRTQPLYFEGLAIGMEGLSNAFFKALRSVSRAATADKKLKQLWEMVDDKGTVVGKVETVESAVGLERIELKSSAGKTQRLWHMGPYVSVAGRRYPQWVVMEQFAEAGHHIRIESWNLRTVQPLDAATRHTGKPLESPPGTEIREMQWH